MRTRSEVDETRADRAARYKLRGTRARAALEKLKALESLKDDKDYRRKAQAAVDEGLDDALPDLRNRPKSYRFVAFVKKTGERAGHGKNQQDALVNAEESAPGTPKSAYEVLEFNNTQGRDVWEQRISLPYARRVADGSLPSRLSKTGIRMLIDGTGKDGVTLTKGGPGTTFKPLADMGLLVNLGGKPWFTSDVGRDALRAFGIKV